ncbi:unnamed protein product [Mytilus coruscus]|uniref:C-type lectin domain-containing protein n=1 Tax=Mytilus coruscus TaxID=42192 RepID=A0A6J8DRM5_MYTCO|nr:unnamed protein product [Mytilus coruscus]
MEARLGVFLLLLVTVLQAVVQSGYIGCYRDDSTRILPKAVLKDKGMTVQKCQQFCGKKGFKFAGVEYGYECFCGNVLRKCRKRKESDCKMPCSGNKRQTCGGPWRISIYTVCPLGWKIYGSSCYFFSRTMVTWNDAKRNCITKNSMLAEVVSYGERDFLRKRASEYAETFWLGGTDSKNEGSWIWATSQSNFIVTGWHTRLVKEPNNRGGNENCNNIHKKLDFEWNDDSCFKRYRYICEKLLV